EMLELIKDLSTAKGVNAIVSSHLLPDIERCCDHVVVLDKGRAAASGLIDALKQPRGLAYELRVKVPAGMTIDGFIEKLRAAGIECHPAEGDLLRLFVPAHPGAREIFAIAAGAGVQVRHLRPSVPTLDDVFATAVGEP